MTLEGNELRIGRPKAYAEPNEDGSLLLQPGGSSLAAASGIQNPLMGGISQSKVFHVYGPSKVL
jgi:hypothetical protein